MQRFGMRLNKGKSVCLDPRTTSPDIHGPDGIVVTKKGFVALGGPIACIPMDEERLEVVVRSPEVLSTRWMSEREVAAPVGGPEFRTGFYADKQVVSELP